jgi:phage protein
MFQGYRTHFKQNIGLSVRDWRYVVRIANIDMKSIKEDISAGPNLINLMIRAEEKMHSLTGCRPVWYMNQELRTFLRLQKNKVHGSTITEDMEMGKMVTRANGIPVRKIDALLSTEARVTA